MYSSSVGSNLNTLIKFTFRKLSKKVNNNFLILKSTYVRKMASQDRMQDVYTIEESVNLKITKLKKMQMPYMSLLLDACGFRKVLSSHITKDILTK